MKPLEYKHFLPYFDLLLPFCRTRYCTLPLSPPFSLYCVRISIILKCQNIHYPLYKIKYVKQIEYNNCATHFSAMVFKCFRISRYPIPSIKDNITTYIKARGYNNRKRGECPTANNYTEHTASCMFVIFCLPAFCNSITFGFFIHEMAAGPLLQLS